MPLRAPSANWISNAVVNRFLWAAVGGLLLGAAFPKIGMAGLAWVAPGWILFSAVGRPTRDRVRLGYVGGFAYALVAFYWIALIPFPAGAIAGWVALSAYLGLYMASWVWLCWRWLDFLTPAPDASPELQASLRVDSSSGPFTPTLPGLTPSLPAVQWVVAADFLRVPVVRRVLWAFGCAVLWVGLEMLLARLFTGFPWNLLGVSQYRILPLLQITPFTGVYGVSFLVVWFSVGLGSAAMALLSRPGDSKSWVGDLILPLLALLITIAYGSTEMARHRPAQRTLEAVLVQPSIPQTLIWDMTQSSFRFKQLVTLSERALDARTNAHLLVWPEAAVPNMLRYDLETYQAVTNLAISRNVWMILGSDDAMPRDGAGPAEKRDYDIYNSSFLVSPRGELVASYRKRALVIFGEYIPLERWFPFMKYLTPVGGSFTAGRRPRPFPIPELGVKISVLICFEDIFPHLGREYIEPDTDFLLNLTNNGWFGESAAQWQHAANAVLRAVENRIPLVRCANNGLTCWVDVLGGMHDVYFDGTADVYGAGFKSVQAPILEPGEKRELTFYTRHGDYFGWTCFALTALWTAACGAKAVQARRARPELADGPVKTFAG